MSSLVFHRSETKMGFHIPKMKTMYESFARLINTPLRSYQIYLGNSRKWGPPEADLDDLMKTRNLLIRNCKTSFIHASLLYNMAGSTDDIIDPNYNFKLNNTRKSLLRELDIGTHIGAGVVVHIGINKNTEAGIQTIANTINTVLVDNDDFSINVAKNLEIPLYEFKKTRKLILENSAGEKNKIGSSLEQIAQIIDLVDDDVRDQVGVCIDTAHAFGAGQYDFGSPDQVVKFYDDFDNIIGLERLSLFHLNDSRVKYGQKADRHENLMLGYMFSDYRDDGVVGSEGLRELLGGIERHCIPFIGEPPAKTKDGEDGPGGVWDYAILRKIYDMEKVVFI